MIKFIRQVVFKTLWYLCAAMNFIDRSGFAKVIIIVTISKLSEPFFIEYLSNANTDQSSHLDLVLIGFIIGICAEKISAPLSRLTEGQSQ